MRSGRITQLVAAVGFATLLALSCTSERSTPPSFKYDGSRACAGVLAYAWSSSGTEQLVVEFNRRRLGLAVGSSRQVNLAEGDVVVRVEMFDRKPGGTHCTDVFFGTPVKPRIWRATSGTVSIALSTLAPGEDRPVEGSYHVAVTLDHVTFRGPGGEQVTARGPLILSGQGGWLPGGTAE